MNINIHQLQKTMSSSTPEALRLAVLRIAYESNEHPVYEVFAERRRITACAEEGKVALVWGGMDCDGVQYSGSVAIVDATPEAVAKEIDHTYKWADGPCHYYLERPSIAQAIQYASRDLALEAFEEGRPYFLVT